MTMRSTLTIMLVSLVMLACGQRTNAETGNEPTKQGKDCVEVIYFHGKQRCVTCRSIEQHTKDVLNAQYAKQMNAGRVVWRVIDISKKENEAIAEKYQVTWSSLFLVNHKNGKEQAENLTEFAFGNARSNPEKFKEGLQQRINQALK